MLQKAFVIDDNPVDCLIAEKIITLSLENVQVHSSNNPVVALDYLRHVAHENPGEFPHYIFLDINMPVIDGWTLLDQLTMLPPQLISRCTVFMLSSSMNNNDLNRSGKYEVVKGYFCKPLTKEILQSAVNNVKLVIGG